MHLDPFVVAHALGLAAAAALFVRRLELDRRRAVLIAAAMACGTIAGAIALGLVLRLPRALHGDVELFGGGLLMAYGALMGACAAAGLAARKLRVPVLATLDALAPSLGVLVLAGRLGCSFAGCCFGEISEVPWAIAHGAGTPAFADQVDRGLVAPDATSALPVHPAALYEAALGAAMICVAILLARRSRRGAPFAMTALLYAAGRFALELVRGDPRPFAGPLSLAQWLSVLVVAALSVWAEDLKRGRPRPARPRRAGSRRR
jgi:phosphatidylglycerol---prolipoprotein diacylglyceryl transferase